MNLSVHSIFDSISGEVGMFQQGSRCTFIRLQGCNVRCNYCDTKYASLLTAKHQILSIGDILKQIKEIGNKQVLIIGGEPLLQKDELKVLVEELHSNGYQTQIETNGTIAPDFYAMCWVVDYKLPSSGVTGLPWQELINEHIYHWDYLKFVCSGYTDFKEAGEIVKQMKADIPEGLIPKFAMSANFNTLDPAILLEWMKKEPGLKDVLLNVQIHKYIGLKEDNPGGKLPNKIKDL